VEHLRAVDSLLSPEGWVYASSPPVEDGDPGRYHALFGRDSLIFALQVLPERPSVAAATLRALAALQGNQDDPETDEEPGKIIHEYRPVAPSWLVEAGWPLRDGGIRYYGTSDATSWFLVLLAATGDQILRDELADPVRRAAGWLERALERGSGLVRCGPRTSPGGLAQQGWRDSLDPDHDEHGGGIVGPDGRAPAPPLADADSQAAAFAALRALEVLDPTNRAHWSRAAEELRERIVAVLTPEVMAVDGAGAPVAGAGSQLGWLLWSGALEGAGATRAADRLCEPDVLTPHGVRTLSSAHPAYLPHGYHRGGVWPFDSWIAWGGLRAAGRAEEAERVRSGVRAAVAALGRYPELYAVTADGTPEPVPVANRVQAWTVGAMLAFDLDWTGRA
jgi:glycogen debranching enzyme